MENLKKTIKSFEEQLFKEKDYRKQLELRGQIDSIKSKIRTQQKEEKKKNLRDKFLNIIQNPPLPKNIISWSIKGSMPNLIEGHYQDKKIFEIKKGILLFELKIVNKKNIDEKFIKPHSSTDIITLQKKANKILSNLYFL